MLIAAANAGYLKGCSGLTASAISKFTAIEDATEMGHMKQLQQGVQSTLTKSRRGRPAALTQQLTRDATTMDAISTPPQEPSNIKTRLVFMTVEAPEGFIAINQTGKYPKTSKEGMKCISVFYIFDPNFIKGIPLKSRKKEELLRAYKEVYSWCESRGFKPQLHKMDNETSRYVKDFISSQQTIQKYTPPYTHRANPAERALQIYKSCIKSTIASLPPTSPTALWCKLLP